MYDALATWRIERVVEDVLPVVEQVAVGVEALRECGAPGGNERIGLSDNAPLELFDRAKYGGGYGVDLLWLMIGVHVDSINLRAAGWQVLGGRRR